MEIAKSDIIFVLGAPGAGKGTLCKQLAAEYGFKHLSIGDLLRRITARPDADEKVKGYIQRGELLPAEMMFPILKTELDDMKEEGPILLDGFPRRLVQGTRFEEVIGQPVLVLFFDCPKDLAEERVVNRALGRAGDDRETFRKRHAEFLELNPPVLDYYAGNGKLVKVDTSGKSDASYAKLMEVLGTRPEWKMLTDKT